MSSKKNLSNSVDDMIARKLSRSKANEYDNQIVPIVDEVAFYYNSINVLIGKQGTGKTINILYVTYECQKSCTFLVVQ